MAGTLTDRIYYHAPIWAQNFLVSLKGLEFRYRRGNDQIIRKQYEFLLSSEHWPPEKFRQYQGEQFRKLLRLAFSQVPYYRDLQKKLGCAPEDFKEPEDIRLLPVLEKSQLRGHEHLFLNESIDLKKCTKGFTSGTTGTPINLSETRESFSRRWGFVARLRHWAGVNNPLHPKRAQFTGRNIVPNRQDKRCQVYWRWNRPGNSLLLSTTHISPETAPHYVAALKSFAPELIDGYPSAMLVIARVVRRLGLELPSPKAIIVSAETLLPEHRRELEVAFSCRVHNQYSSSEPSCFWGDCEYGVMHENPEYGISEIIDANGKPVQAGESGEVLTTSFLNPLMVLIRYRLGDVAVKGPGTLCACGRAMPRLQGIEGRMDDILFTPERGYVGRLDPVFKGLGAIIEAQIIQENLNQVRVLLVPDAGYNDEMEAHLTKNLQAKLGESVKLAVERVNQIPRGPNGKFRSVVSNVRHLYPDQM